MTVGPVFRHIVSPRIDAVISIAAGIGAYAFYERDHPPGRGLTLLDHIGRRWSRFTSSLKITPTPAIPDDEQGSGISRS
ncbi:hypothetical protein GQ42DRAFT_46452 [Ramicandelaber brevisporus]|nr:hypothetical protein GQ42DRAFT_46452 [Ramicandelaber brevisporus]